jgi:hypothetical protein
MGDKWSQVAPDAGEKQEKRFEAWSSGRDIAFESAEARERYRERVTLIQDAVQMKRTPRRVPVCPSPGHFPLEYAGVTFRDAMYDVHALTRALKKYYDDFDQDTFSGPFIGSGRVLDLLDAKQYQWPGHGVPEDREYQFVEGEYVKAEEYDSMIRDPSGFHLRVFLPRICGALKGLEKIPQLVNIRHMSSMLPGALPFNLPEVQKALRVLVEAGAEAALFVAGLRELGKALMAGGRPSFSGGMAEAPYDVIADSFRGTRGISLDLRRCPDKLLQACENYVYPQIERAVAAADLSGNPLIFMPLHKGAHSFMSTVQFREFYWPTLRKVLIGLINEGLVPLVFAESDYNSRLEIICDLPRSKTVWWFEKVDMARAKETVGKVACIAGNVPNILFRAGTPDEIKAYCKNLIDVAGKNGGYILSTAAGLQGARPENVKAMIEYGKRYGVYA